MKVAISGFRHGHIASIVSKVRDHPDLEIVACCEEEPQECADIIDRCDINVDFRVFDEMLEEVDFDILAICDIYAKRGRQAIKALETGKHVISDKPLCTRPEELESIEKLVAEKRLSLTVGLSLRSSPAIQTARKLVQDGEIGEITNGIVTGYHGLNYRSGRPDWYFEEGAQEGTINDLMVHGVDSIQWITGIEIAEVLSAHTAHFEPKSVPFFQDVAMASFKLANEAGVFIDASYKTPEGHSSPWTFHFIGTEGALEIDLGRKIVLRKDNQAEREVPPRMLNDTNFVNDIVAEISGRSDYEPLLTTRECLDSTAKTLAAQQAADEGLANVKLS